jgi:hypothetical protein
MPLQASTAKICRLGFMSGQFTVPDDFDRLGSRDIEQRFGSES